MSKVLHSSYNLLSRQPIETCFRPTYLFTLLFLSFVATSKLSYLRGNIHHPVQRCIDVMLRLLFYVTFMSPVIRLCQHRRIPLNLFLVLSAIYLPSYMDGSERSGGKSRVWFKSLSLWGSLTRNYFNLKLVRTTPLDPTQHYIFGLHPHAISPYGSILNLHTEANAFSKLFPGVKIRTLAASILFYVPIIRDLWLSLGFIDASKFSAMNVLKSYKSNDSMPMRTHTQPQQASAPPVMSTQKRIPSIASTHLQRERSGSADYRLACAQQQGQAAAASSRNNDLLNRAQSHQRKTTTHFDSKGQWVDPMSLPACTTFSATALQHKDLGVSINTLPSTHGSLSSISSGSASSMPHTCSTDTSVSSRDTSLNHSPLLNGSEYSPNSAPGSPLRSPARSPDRFSGHRDRDLYTRTASIQASNAALNPRPPTALGFIQHKAPSHPAPSYATTSGTLNGIPSLHSQQSISSPPTNYPYSDRVTTSMGTATIATIQSPAMLPTNNMLPPSMNDIGNQSSPPSLSSGSVSLTPPSPAVSDTKQRPVSASTYNQHQPLSSFDSISIPTGTRNRSASTATTVVNSSPSLDSLKEWKAMNGISTSNFTLNNYSPLSSPRHLTNGSNTSLSSNSAKDYSSSSVNGNGLSSSSLNAQPSPTLHKRTLQNAYQSSLTPIPQKSSASSLVKARDTPSNLQLSIASAGQYNSGSLPFDTCGPVSVAVFVGGKKECLLTNPPRSKHLSRSVVYTLYLRKRKGFIRLAMQTGSHLVPVFTFGDSLAHEQLMYADLSNSQRLKPKQLQEKKSSASAHKPSFDIDDKSNEETQSLKSRAPEFIVNTLRSLNSWWYNVFGVPIPIVKNIWPRRCNITTVVGKPIPVRLNANPSESEVNELHLLYINELTKLFYESRAKYDSPGSVLRII